MARAYAYLLLPLALLGWLLFQLAIKKKKLKDIYGDILLFVFIILIWTSIYYWAS